MYRESPSAVKQRKWEEYPVWRRLALGAFLLSYFTFLPIILFVVVHWAVYSFTMNNLYQQAWVVPFLIIFSTFLAGAFMRQRMEDEIGGLGTFVLGIIALLVFALLTVQDIKTSGGVYSRYMPKLLKYSLLDYTYMLPGVGVLGMLFYKYFTLKHYS